MAQKVGSQDPLIHDEEIGLRLVEEQGHKVGFNGDAELYSDDGKKLTTEEEFGVETRAKTEVRDHVQAVIDETEGLQKPTIVRNLMIAYVLSILIVILLSIAGQLAVHIVIHKSFSDSAVVNVAGRQRMLSQLITKDIVTIAYFKKTSGNVTFYVDQLRSRLPLWYTSHYGLIKGNKTLGVSKTSSSSVKKSLDYLTPTFLSMYYAAENVSALDLIGLTANSSEFETLTSQLNVILSLEPTFLIAQDNITKQYENIGRSHLNSVLDLSWVLHALVILTLLLEGLFLFRPVLRKMQELINERFGLMRRTLVAEAESSGVSLLMMGYISNELKTPVKAITDYLSAAETAISTHAEREVKHDFVLDGMRADCQSAIDNIHDTSVCLGLMETIVSDVSNMQSMQIGRISVTSENVDVVQVLRQVVKLVEKKVHEGVVLEVSVATSIQDDPTRLLDKQRLLQVLINLVNHAIGVTKEGTITVDVKEIYEEEKLRIEVVDQGSPLDADEQVDVFQPVMGSPGTSKRGASSEGQGLALYVVRMLVELQGGTVGTENVPGAGNLFWVELPAVKAGDAK